MHKISLLLWGLSPLLLPHLGYAAETHELLEITVENWARKNLPMGSHFQKVIFNPHDINDDLKDHKVKNKENHIKIPFDGIGTCFAKDQIKLEIVYHDEPKVTESFTDKINHKFTIKNKSGITQSNTIETPEIWDHFAWNLDAPLTKNKIAGQFVLETTKGTSDSVEVSLVSPDIFQGKAKKCAKVSRKIEVPTGHKLIETGAFKKEKIEQRFMLKLSIDIHFAVVYKSAIQKKPKIHIYHLSSVYPEPIFIRPGTFKGTYVTMFDHKGTMRNLNTRKEQEEWNNSTAY